MENLQGDIKQEGFKQMKKQKKWTIPLIVLTVCAVAVFLMHPGKAAAATQAATLDPTTIDYLNPFDLTVRQISVSQSVSTSGNSVPVQSSAVTMSSVSQTSVTTSPASVATPLTRDSSSISYSVNSAKPLKVWIPFRPTFRSPCTPSLY
jgi:hypothetical protein